MKVNLEKSEIFVKNVNGAGTFEISEEKLQNDLVDTISTHEFKTNEKNIENDTPQGQPREYSPLLIYTDIIKFHCVSDKILEFLRVLWLNTRITKCILFQKILQDFF
ncbi:hypothetical protein GQX74_007636 [Glossina fuscipes]|nr:hypothetical protein GQX74_007636 [Glossina fuscipes]